MTVVKVTKCYKDWNMSHIMKLMEHGERHALRDDEVVAAINKRGTMIRFATFDEVCTKYAEQGTKYSFDKLEEVRFLGLGIELKMKRRNHLRKAA